MSAERIIAAAIKVGDAIVSVPQPGRHHTVLLAALEAGLSRRAVVEAEQGFLTSVGRFVGRETAARVAFAAGQIDEQRLGLVSEMVW